MKTYRVRVPCPRCRHVNEQRVRTTTGEAPRGPIRIECASCGVRIRAGSQEERIARVAGAFEDLLKGAGPFGPFPQ